MSSEAPAVGLYGITKRFDSAAWPRRYPPSPGPVRPEPTGNQQSGKENGMSSEAPAVGLYGITKRFDDVTAVDAVDLEIADGEFFALLGPSGCGKTTTLRLIAGLEFPTRGSLKIFGNEVGTLPPNKRPVNTVFQNYALFPHMTVEENVAFGLRMQRVPKAEIRSRVREAIRAGPYGRDGAPPLQPTLRRTTTTRRPGPGLGQQPQGVTTRRAPRRTGPQAPPSHAARAQGAPTRGGDHLRLRHPRPGRSASP